MSSLFFFFSLLLLHVVVGDIVDDTCKKASQSDPKLNFNFCVASLRKNPKSSSADLQGLGIISVELATIKANSISSDIKTRLSDPKLGSNVKQSLQDCAENYSDAILTLRDAANAFKAKDYSTANINLSAAMDQSSTCEDGFKDKGVPSPLTKQNNDYFQLTAIGLAITKLLE